MTYNNNTATKPKRYIQFGNIVKRAEKTMIQISSAFGSDSRNERPPVLPGDLLEKLIMPKFNLEASDLSSKSGISLEELGKIFRGKAIIDESVRKKLRSSLGHAADMLYDYQRAYSQYLLDGHWPPSSRPK